MLEPRGQANLLAEPLGPKRRRDFRVEDLEGYRPVMLQVVRQENGRKPAASDLTLDSISVGERVSQQRDRIGHAWSVWLGEKRSDYP